MTRIVIVGLLAATLGAGAAWWLQGQRTEVLRTEIGLLREEQDQLVRLKAENRRLAAAQVSAEELARLRNDHAAVERMREEIGKLRTGVESRERAVAKPAGAKDGPGPVPATPALTLGFDLGSDGNFSTGGGAVDAVWLKQRLAALPEGSAVAIRVKLPRGESGATQVTGTMPGWAVVRAVAKELKLKVSMVLESVEQK